MNYPLPINNAEAPQTRYVVLDGLRGIAAVVVVLCHIEPLLQFYPPNANLAVDFFFCLSGVVLAHAYGARLKSDLSPTRFVRLRIIRLYPLYALGSAIGLAAWSAGAMATENLPALQVLPLGLPLAIVMVPTWAGLINFPLNGPAWSLCLEMAASVGYSIVQPFGRTRTLLSVAIAAAIGLALFVRKFGSADLGWQTQWSALGGVARVGYSFTVGLLIYAVHHRRRVSLPGSWAAGALLVTILLAPRGTHLGYYQGLCIFFVLPVLVYTAASIRPGGRSAGIFRFLGEMSYPLYAIHWPLYQFTYHGLGRMGIDLSRYAPLSGLLFVAVSVWMAGAVYKSFDIPVRRGLMRLEARWTAAREVRAAQISEAAQH